MSRTKVFKKRRMDLKLMNVKIKNYFKHNLYTFLTKSLNSKLKKNNISLFNSCMAKEKGTPK